MRDEGWRGYGPGLDGVCGRPMGVRVRQHMEIYSETRAGVMPGAELYYFTDMALGRACL